MGKRKGRNGTHEQPADEGETPFGAGSGMRPILKSRFGGSALMSGCFDEALSQLLLIPS